MKKILIVEDDEILALVMQKYIEKMNFEVVDVVVTGNKAIQSVKNKVPDLILMDIMIIGDMDGIDTMKEIRKFSDVPVIYATGNSDPKAKERADTTSMSDFLTKPIDFNLLQKSILKVLQD